jgi:hypothetical protein
MKYFLTIIVGILSSLSLIYLIGITIETKEKAIEKMQLHKCNDSTHVKCDDLCTCDSMECNIKNN